MTPSEYHDLLLRRFMRLNYAPTFLSYFYGHGPAPHPALMHVTFRTKDEMHDYNWLLIGMAFGWNGDRCERERKMRGVIRTARRFVKAQINCFPFAALAPTSAPEEAPR